MRILFLGDIVGKSGRDLVSSLLLSLKETYKADIVIVNGENSAHGKGITSKIYRQLINAGADYITLGNHAFSKSEIIEASSLCDRLVFPYNHKLRTNENYYLVFEYNEMKFCLTNILGQSFIPESSGSPFDTMDMILKETEDMDIDFYLVDLHGEATAEKLLFANYYKKYKGAVLGTHTHIQTADERIIGGIAYISDVGMCGPYDSIIGRDTNEVIESLIKHNKTHYTISDGASIVCGAVIDIDEDIKQVVNINRIQKRPY